MRSKLLGLKVSEEEMEKVRRASVAAGYTSLSKWVRETLLSQADLATRKPPVVPLPQPTLKPQTWPEKWTALEKMDSASAGERLADLARGRKFPEGFKAWPRIKKIAWLERNWPL